MRLLTSFLLLICLISIQAKQLNIIPVPAEVAVSGGFFTLKAQTGISYNSGKLSGIARNFVQRINAATGFNIKAKKGGTELIQLIISDKEIAGIGKEGYLLEITTGNIDLTANTEAGILYGLQTLLQLMPVQIMSKSLSGNIPWEIPAVKIKDYPRFEWRGLMLDVSRHFFSKEDVKTFIDQMVQFKFNTFHWHLSDDQGWRVEIKSLPRLTEVGAWRAERYGQFGTRMPQKPGEKASYGGFYTHEDIREIVAYASERNITIVPEIDIPGHSMAAIAAYPELSCTKDTGIRVDPGANFSEWYGNGTFKMNVDNTLDPSDEKVYEFLDKVFDEMAQLFPGQYIHVGGDECYKGYWKQDSSCQALMKKLGIRHIEDLQGYFTGRVEEILKSKGKKMLGWDEILDGGASKDAAIMCWRNLKIGTEAASNGYKVVMCPTAYSYLDYVQGEPTIESPVYASLRLRQCYKLEPSPLDSLEKNILGGQGNLWAENIPDLRYAQYMLWPRALAISEIYWSKKDHKNWSNFIQRVEHQFVRFDYAEINYSKAIYDPEIKTIWKEGQMWVEIQAEAPEMNIYYTINGTMPDNKASLYIKPFALPEGEITLRVKCYRNNREKGNLIILRPADLRNRAY